MTTVISYADASSDDLSTVSFSSYSAALNGASVDVFSSYDYVASDQDYDGSSYLLTEAFTRYAYTLDTASQITSAYFEFTVYTATGTPSRDLEIREYDWGTSVSGADWRTPSQLNALSLLGTVVGVQNSGGKWRASSPTLLTRLGTTGELRTVANSSRQRQQFAPGANIREYVSFNGPAASGTAQDPALIYTTAPLSALHRVLGAQVQLSDGTHAFLESTASASSPTVALRFHDGTTASTVATVPTGTTSGTFGVDSPSGMQNFALVRDAADNLYVLGRAGRSSAAGVVNAGKAYVKGVGHTWTAAAMVEDTLSPDPSYLTDVAATWHSAGGTAGTIAAVFAHAGSGADGNFVGQQYWTLISCDTLLAGSGTLKRGSGFVSTLLDVPATSDLVSYHNPTGTGLDIHGSSALRGYVASYNHSADLGGVGDTSQSRYTLATGASGVSDTAKRDTAPQAVRDANSKLRVIAVSDTQYVVVAVSSVSGVGPRVVIVENIGSSTSSSVLGDVALSAQSIASLPAEATLASSAAWDVAYDPHSNKLWFYYFDTANGRRLMRTGVDLATRLADRSETQVNATVGATGSSNLALRTHRGTMTGSQILISVANMTSGGVHSTIYVTDQFNLAPTAPTLTPTGNFDATLAKVFAWAFNDPNTGDTQSAYQLQINTSVGVTAVDTGKVTSTTPSRTVAGATLSNPGSWQWRVQTWDALNTQGVYSPFSTFSTAAGGTVTITSPAADHPTPNDVSSWNITWAVTGATQDSYQVAVYNNATNVQLSTTGWVTSTATTATVSLPTDIEWRIEVTIRQSGVSSNTGTRLITPSYGTPVAPTFVLQDYPDAGYVLVLVTNPTPDGNRPEVVTNEVYRRPLGSTGAYELAGTAVRSGTFLDYGVASGVTYEYFVRGVSA
ncbi:MAG TPA: hypothetical protein VGL46_05040 [Pseudonocardiaceae bacterium]|jgi:hypothetical protein